MKKKLYIFFIACFVCGCTFSQNTSNQNSVKAQLSLIQSESGGQHYLIITLSFTNMSGKDIFIGDVLQYLTNDNGGVFNVYKDGHFLHSSIDPGMSGKGMYYQILHPVKNEIVDYALPQGISNTYGKYIGDSIAERNFYGNRQITKKYFQDSSTHSADRRDFFINEECLFLKAYETYNYYFASSIADITNDSSGEYTIMYQPTLRIQSPSFPEIQKILTYERVFPKKIKCNKIIIRIVK